MRIRTALGLIGATAGAAALWWRKNPSACPYGQRFWVELPHPIVTRERLRSVLRPERGERLLEIGPGTGYYTLDIAEWVGGSASSETADGGSPPPSEPAGGGNVSGRDARAGTVEIFDLQQEFLDHTMRRAAERGLTNVVPTQGDATALPYEDGSIDAVVLTAVLGEIPDPAAALREIHRVLKPTGRLIVGELFGDPHFTTLASLKRQATEAGLAYEHHSGNRLAYFARLRPV